jgi:hypothetical protein
MNRITVMINPDKRDVKKEHYAEKDRYETVICILCHEVRFVRVEAEGSKLIFIFDKREISTIEDKLLTGKSFSIPWQNVMPALNIWKDAFIALKDIRRNAK